MTTDFFKRLSYCFVVFMSGFVVAINIAILRPNLNYSASWIKVTFASLLAVCFSVIIATRKSWYDAE
jgi:hypothetical protein